MAGPALVTQSNCDALDHFTPLASVSGVCDKMTHVAKCHTLPNRATRFLEEPRKDEKIMKEVKAFTFSDTLKTRFSDLSGNKYIVTAMACIEAAAAKASKAQFFHAFREVGGYTCASSVLLDGLRFASTLKIVTCDGTEASEDACVAQIDTVVEALKASNAAKAEKAREARAAVKAKGTDDSDKANVLDIVDTVAGLSLVDGLDKLGLSELKAYKASLVVAIRATRQAIRAKEAEKAAAEKAASEKAAADAELAPVLAIAADIHPLSEHDADKAIRAMIEARRAEKAARKVVNA